MRGAIVGDIIGSSFEKQYPGTFFDIYAKGSKFTDDTILTAAIADATLHHLDYGIALKTWGKAYLNHGYSKKFTAWLTSDRPMYSDTNGAVMRISPIGWLAKNIDEIPDLVSKASLPTHGHPDAILAATVVAEMLFLLRLGTTKTKVFKHFLKSYPKPASVLAYRNVERFDMSALGTIMRSVAAWYEGQDYISTVKQAISIGGDTDTNAAIAGALAEVTTGLPDTLWNTAKTYLPVPILSIEAKFRASI